MGDMSTNAETRMERVSLAFDIRERLKVDEFLRLIPVLSPSERSWLRQELDAGGTRMTAAAAGKEFAIMKARSVMEGVEIFLDIIDSGEGNEFGAWTYLAYILMDNGETEYIAHTCQKGIVSPCPFDDWSGDYLFAFQFYTQGISRQIVLGVLGPKFGIGFQDE